MSLEVLCSMPSSCGTCWRRTRLRRVGMQIRSELNMNSRNSLQIRSQRKFAANLE